MTDSDKRRISVIHLDDASLATTNAEAKHERRIAIFDLIEENSFDPAGVADGPYALRISLKDRSLILDIENLSGEMLRSVQLSLTPFRRHIKDYFFVCDSYYEAINNATPQRIETLDMARRSVHNEASELLSERLRGKVALDFFTSRRLFTLICALYRRPG